MKVFVVLLLAAGCGGGSGNSGGGSPTGPTATSTITITSSGVSPRDITVTPGSRVTFVNNDNRSHTMNSDPHPEHGQCPAIDQVGFIAAGQSKQTGNLNDVRTCRFHEHDLFPNSNFEGSIVVR